MTGELTADQRATLHLAYRSASARSIEISTLRELIADFANLCGLEPGELWDIAREDKLQNPELYKTLSATRDGAQTLAGRKKAEERSEAQRASRAKKRARRGAYKAKVRADQVALTKRAEEHPEDFLNNSHCPVCRRNLGDSLMPQHDDDRGRPCKGSGRIGVTKVTAESKRLPDSKADSDWITKPWTVRGGLPSQNKRRR